MALNSDEHNLIRKIDDEWKIDEIKCNKKALDEYDLELASCTSNIPDDQKNIFEKTMKKCKENSVLLYAKSKKIENEINEINTITNLKEDENTEATEKKFSHYMDYIAISTIIVIGILMVLAITCPLPNCHTSGYENPFTSILESNFFMVLIGTIVGPIVSKFLKEKYDIQIKSDQISMITSDAINAVTMYQKSSAQLRDDDGNIPKPYQEKLQNLALDSIYKNFGAEKYSELISSLGGQVFKKAIEAAVSQKKIEGFPLEKKQVEGIIRQSIDAVPYIVDWQKHDDAIKDTFIRGYVKNLLQNTCAEGWGYKSLEGIFDADVNRRISAAAIADTRKLIPTNSKDPIQKYTSIVVDSILASGIDK